MKREITEEAISLAEKWRKAVLETMTSKEKRHFLDLAKMGADSEGKKTVFQILDQAFRSKNPFRVRKSLLSILEERKFPAFMTPLEKAALWTFCKASILAPPLFVGAVKKVVRKKAGEWVFGADGERLKSHILARKKEGVSINVNYLGEAIIGEEEAEKRLKRYLEYMRDPDVEAISIKISSLYSQINLVAFEATKEILKERFRRLLAEAKKGSKAVIHFDMEEYRDLDLTLAVFKETLSEEPFREVTAGIALQAYLPDAFEIAKDLVSFAKERRIIGGAPIKIRLVKGANLSVEKIESSIRGWPLAPYSEKKATDRNFLRIAEFLLQKENQDVILLGVGSHNLFDLAYVTLLQKEAGGHSLTLEMLEGMMNPLVRLLAKEKSSLLLYCPVVEEKDFESAMAYLFRRLDEISTEGNFLFDFFTIEESQRRWDRQKKAFLESLQNSEPLSSSPSRTQDRSRIRQEVIVSFENEPDTDFSLPRNRSWAQEIYRSAAERKYGQLLQGIDGKRVPGEDPEEVHFHYPFRSIPSPFYFKNASLEQVGEAISCAKGRSFHPRPFSENQLLLKNASRLLRDRRGLFISAMILNTYKTFQEADAEVSEAIDFIDYYRFEMEKLSEVAEAPLAPVGPIVVASPWNFPLSIPCGGIASALAARNPVLFKPAEEAVLVGTLLAELFWDAGFDCEELQLLLCRDEPEGALLVEDPRVERVLLTGGTATAKKLMTLQGNKVKLMAETGGKNCFIISALCDEDLAIRDLLLSAFSNAGQKCSAASILLLDRELYENHHFLHKLRDAAMSMSVGEALDPQNSISPLIRKPDPFLMKALTELQPGESWLLAPVIDPDNPLLVTPGIKMGVSKEAYSATQELFGPLLSVIPYSTLKEAIEIVNSRVYGLVSGLHTLDPGEMKEWIRDVQAGNLYINRPIVGALVGRQPFGGIKESQYGYAFKAGGINTLLPLVLTPLKEKAEDYEAAFQKYFLRTRKTADLIGQENLYWTLPRQELFFRVQEGDSPGEVALVKKGALTVGATLLLSHWQEEKEEEFLKRLLALKRPSVRLLSDQNSALIKILNSRGATIILGSPSQLGRFELPRYMREVSLSRQTHRYGFLLL